MQAMQGSRCGGSALRVAAPLQPAFTAQRPARSLKRSRQQLTTVAASGAGILQRLGRVLKEKAESDFDRFFKGTSKTRERLGLVEELLTFWSLEDYETSLEELEEALITADFGPKTALKIVDVLRERIKAGELKTADDLRAGLKSAIIGLLANNGNGSELKLSGKPAVVLVCGVNGAGKTTTIGKLSHKFSNEGAKVYLVPGDTFRAAAAEQLREWAARSGAVMGAFQDKAKPQKVLAAGVADAVSRGDIDVVICDTAGRLHTAYGLMDELTDCQRAIRKAAGGSASGQPCETLLVLDGTTGLNMLNQAKEFNDSVPLTGLILTKLDGSARGGAVVSVVDQLGLPVKFVGVGEALEDLQAFDPDSFAEALFPKGGK